MTFWQFLNHWWNLPSLVMLGLVGVFFVLQAVGFFTHHDAEHDADVDHGVGAGDGAGDAHLDHDADVDHDADADHDHDAGADHGEGVLGSLAAFLGVGRVPFMVVWLTMFIFAGFGGLFVNRALFDKATGAYPAWGFPLSLLASLFVGGVATRFAAKQVAKIVDVGGKGASSRRELAGRWGIVASPSADSEFGEVRVRDERGHELLVHGKLATGPALPQGAKVLLVDLDAKSGLYIIEKFDTDEAVKKQKA